MNWDCLGAGIILTYCSIPFFIILFGSLYTNLNLPEFSIVEFSVPALNRTSDQTSGGIYFDLKLRNMNKAVGLYYDDPSSITFSYYSPEEPYQKYVWTSALTHFYQGNGKTKHIVRKITDENHVKHDVNYLRLPSEAVGVGKAVPVVNVRINLVVDYRFKLLWDSSKHGLEAGAEVMVYANTGERVSKGSFQLVKTSDAMARPKPILLMVLCMCFLIIMAI